MRTIQEQIDDLETDLIETLNNVVEEFNKLETRLNKIKQEANEK